MPTELNFVKNQDRSFFNVYTPVRRSYDDVFPDFNKRGPLPEQSEVDRQTGSGIFRTMPVRSPGAIHNGRGIFDNFVKDVHDRSKRFWGFGASPMANNHNPSVKAPVNKVYEYSPQYQRHAPIVSKIHNPIQHGSGPFAPLRNHNQPNPAINNWLPGTKIPEPTKIYEHSAGLQFHSKPSEPIIIPPRRGPTISGHMSYDDMKPYSQTQQHYNNPFGHIQHNPIKVKY